MSRQNWLDWRHKGIGSSDAAAIMGVSPYKTALQLWEEKVKPDAKEKPSNWAMEKGNEYEPIARQQFCAHYNLQNGTEETFDPLLVELAEAPFMRASLDGSASDRSTIIEIKYQGKENHGKIVEVHKIIEAGNFDDKTTDFEKTIKEAVRVDYWTQIQHQLLCSNANLAYLVSFDGKKSVAWVPIAPDREYHKKHFRECAKFWDCVVNKTPPGVTDDDFVPLTGMDKAVEEWKILSQQAATLQEQADKIKEDILAKVTHPKMKACGVTIVQVERAGAVDYKKIPELKGIDLEKYRKAGSKYYKMTIEKGQ